jgi:hypothetical protein
VGSADHLTFSAHPQEVCDLSQCFCEVDLITLSILRMYVVPPLFREVDLNIYCLCVLSLYVIFSVLPWSRPDYFNLYHGSSACMWLFSMLPWNLPYHFTLSVHSQHVCDYLMLLWCQLNIYSSGRMWFTIVLDAPLKWLNHYNLGCSACMWLFSIFRRVDLMFAHPQFVRDSSQRFPEVDLTILLCDRTSAACTWLFSMLP